MNQKLKEGKINKGLSLDPLKNNLQLLISHQQYHHRNLNRTQNQNLISKQHAEDEEEDVNSEKQEKYSFHGFQDQIFQQAQELNQKHQLIYGGIDTHTSQTQQETSKKRSYMPSSKEYAILRGKIGDSSTQNQQTMGLRNTGDEIVAVHGGHIVRSTCRKDRHSKVCTTKGPRDRRIRLSAPTAIQFYDVQDRLGYDRPSKAVDWLIKKAKAAIDELQELPAWTPTTNSIPLLNQTQQHYQLQQPTNDNNSSFLSSSMDSDYIADIIKSVFPMGASTDTNSSSAANYQFYHHNFQQPDLLHRNNRQNQDLRLSLQSLQDPMLLHHQNQHHHHHNKQRTSLCGGFDGLGWSGNPSNDMDRFSRMAGGDTSSNGGAFVFNSPPVQQQSMYGQTQLLISRRESLQSNYKPSVHTWIDPSSFSNDHHQTASFPFHPSSVCGTGISSVDGFRIPTRIQGEEEHDGISDKLSSASSDSHY